MIELHIAIIVHYVELVNYFSNKLVLFVYITKIRVKNMQSLFKSYLYRRKPTHMFTVSINF